jgi:hypothetical protein
MFYTDVRLVKSAAEMFYEELLEGGVKIFERKGTMLHTKTIKKRNHAPY